uniref:Uncharacterized protein n=1 Tax=Leptobrachium leishanense TaxID=445787 RepID=A0A8C5MSI1_9ANUR
MAPAKKGALKEIRKFAVKEMHNPDVRIDTRLNKAVWAKALEMFPSAFVCVCPENVMRMRILPTSCNTLVTYVPVTTYKATDCQRG